MTSREIRYWVAKANPSRYSYDERLRAGRVENWHSRFAPMDLQIGERVFLWESGGGKRIAGLGEIAKPVFRKDEDGLRVLRVRYLTDPFVWKPGIDLLKSNSELKNASFLQGGVIRTFYPLTQQEGEALYKLVISGNPTDDVWRDLSHQPSLIDVEVAAVEGRPKLVQHLRRERKPQLAQNKKDQFCATHGRLFCEACSAEFPLYGRFSDAPFEVHHRRELSSAKGETKTSLKDLAVLCSNCHRVIHRTDPMLSVEELAELINRSTRIAPTPQRVSWPGQRRRDVL